MTFLWSRYDSLTARRRIQQTATAGGDVTFNNITATGWLDVSERVDICGNLDVSANALFRSKVDICGNLDVSGSFAVGGISNTANANTLGYNAATGEVTYQAYIPPFNGDFGCNKSAYDMSTAWFCKDIVLGTKSSVQTGIAIGENAGGMGNATSPPFGGGLLPANSIAIGASAGSNDQSSNSIAIGAFAGSTRQYHSSVAIGRNAGNTDQSFNSIAIGYGAGNNTQKQNSIAIGRQAGQTDQSRNSVAIGFQAGRTTQDASSVAIGHQAGMTTQSSSFCRYRL